MEVVRRSFREKSGGGTIPGNHTPGGGSVDLITYASISGDPVAGIAGYDVLIIARGDADNSVLDAITTTAKPIVFMGSMVLKTMCKWQSKTKR